MPCLTGGSRKKSSSKSRKRTTRSRSVSKKRVVKRSTKKKTVKKSGRTKLNKWQKFLQKNRGMGYSLKTLRAKYRKEYM
jgi:hypothetical protein